MKKVITHINPDLDALTSVWLIKKFLPGWEEAEVDFIQATAGGEKIPGVDKNPEILYVDVGRGKLDHHQTKKRTSAAKLCWDYILENCVGMPLSDLDKKAGEELVRVVTQIDNALDLFWPEVRENRYHFYLHTLVEGLRGLGETDHQVLEFGFRSLEAVFLNLKQKIKAEEDLAKGIEFSTRWGKGIGVMSGNRRVLWQGEALGYALVVKKDPTEGGVQIYCRPDSGADLTFAFEKIKKLDPNSDWFLHASKRLLLNQASVNLNMRPTKLSLEEIINILKSV